LHIGFIIIRNEQISHLSLLEGIYCNRTATGLIRTGTHWTKQHAQIIENRLNKRDSRTHWDELERVQANS
jgi:hypothetical protein